MSLLREKPNQPALHLLLEDSVGQPEENRLLHNEQVLVQACRAGDPMAMKDMVSRFQNDVYRVCCRLMADPHEAEDVAQEVFLRVFRSLHTWDQERPLKPWILSIAFNRCRTALTKRLRRPHLSSLLDSNASREAPSERTSDIQQEIHAAVEELRQEYREVFLLFHAEEVPYEEIGSMMRKPVGTIKTWLHRARQAVVKRLQERGVVYIRSEPLHE
ncbi:MAG TPA: RNA polymerase sigma factor [Gemmatales bacterium]|nr:RNA polymerase sigma factor [Gemmatales bacterium]